IDLEKLFSGIKKVVFDSDLRFLWLSSKGVFNKWNDKKYIEHKFEAKMGRELHLEAPITMNEKLQWLKLYDRQTQYVQLVDKYLVRSYIADQIGEQYLIPLLGVWDDPDDINFDELPNQFVLKCNHNSGLGMC